MLVHLAVQVNNNHKIPELRLFVQFIIIGFQHHAYKYYQFPTLSPLCLSLMRSGIEVLKSVAHNPALLVFENFIL